MTTQRPRFTITVPEDLYDKIEEFRWQGRYETKSDATSALLKFAIKKLDENPNLAKEIKEL